MTKPDEIASFSQFSVVSHKLYMPKTLWLDLWACGLFEVDANGDDDDLSHVYLPNFKQL